MASEVTFVGPLGDAHGLAYEFVVSPPSAPAHAAAAATGAAKATTLTWGGRGTSPVPEVMPSPHTPCPETGATSSPSSPAGLPQPLPTPRPELV